MFYFQYVFSSLNLIIYLSIYIINSVDKTKISIFAVIFV